MGGCLGEKNDKEEASRKAKKSNWRKKHCKFPRTIENTKSGAGEMAPQQGMLTAPASAAPTACSSRLLVTPGDSIFSSL